MSMRERQAIWDEIEMSMREPIDWAQARRRIANKQPYASNPYAGSSENIKSGGFSSNNAKINDELDAENDRLTWAMEMILRSTNPDSCGLYDSQNLHEINQHARKALGRPTIVVDNYNDPTETSYSPVDIRSNIAQALKSLSGDLSYDDIAAAKACLKEAIG